eukprot:4316040-Alexandrium_andersonii.AAC.1
MVALRVIWPARVGRQGSGPQAQRAMLLASGFRRAARPPPRSTAATNSPIQSCPSHAHIALG